MRSYLIIAPLWLLNAVALTTMIGPESAAQELPPEMQVDRLLVQAEREIEDGEHWSAVVTFERILAVCEEHGLEVPVEFWFDRQECCKGGAARARRRGVDPLPAGGREGGEHYRAALELLDAAEQGLAEIRREEARALLARERAEREAAARRAAILPSVPEMVAIPAGTFRMGCVSGRRMWLMGEASPRGACRVVRTVEVRGDFRPVGRLRGVRWLPLGRGSGLGPRQPAGHWRDLARCAGLRGLAVEGDRRRL